MKSILAELKTSPDSIEKLKLLFAKKNKNEPRWQDPLASQPSKLVRSSIFSTDADIKADLRGFFNLTMIVVFVANFRLILENFQKYGLITRSPDLGVFVLPAIIGLISFHLPVFLAYVIQFVAFNSNTSPVAIWSLNALLVIATLFVPVYAGTILKPHPGPMIYVFGFICVAALKIISFAHVMRNARNVMKKIAAYDKNPKAEPLGEHEINTLNMEFIRKHKDDPSKLLDIKHYYYFIMAPTLCFQLSYPRNERIRVVWLAKRVIEAIICLALQAFVFNQYMIPALDNTIPLVEQGLSFKLIERLLKLSVPSLYSWILMFFGTFHYGLNISAEILRYGDRQFYLEWWNCHNLNEYWRKWNLPVHNWFMRHMYSPLLKNKVPKELALFLVFFVSAVAHEYIVSAALRMYGYWAFVGMMGQAPIMVLQSYAERIFRTKNSQIGNVMFWISFCIIGQPFCLLIYYYLYVVHMKETV
eukprot:CAMPEP_0176438170 /NCGR_PEP_ID=MMETSP0127-20121128/19114_1 /TAXON_ID=938130 /ORGANISM="Platyophrya macrostoma, Strain WH" /LENGTH=472 /DNA_ID=CAMNT_0017822049 /DNA_START=290 /DNA_END=1708 /DNA_ORIENTATION=+